MDFIQKFFGKTRIYLDYAAATPLLPEARREMEQFLSKDFYNPNSIYREGVDVRRKVEEYRSRIAKVLGVAREAVIFTSGGTEANVLAIRGARPGRVIAEPDAHPSVLDAILPTESEEVVLYSSATPDNKLGRKIREERTKSSSAYPLVHIDASQWAAYYDVGLEKLACDLLTLDAAKLGGPKGIGALVVRHGSPVKLPPRGTHAVPLIAGFCVALEKAAQDREAEWKRLFSLSEGFADKLRTSLPQASVEFLPPHIITLSVPDLLPEYLVLALDQAGVMASAGPACLSQKPEPPETPVRFSLGRQTTEKELNKALDIICESVKNLVK